MSGISQSDLDTLLVEAAQSGRGDEIACGLMAMGITAALLFLRDELDDNGTAPPDRQEAAVTAALLVRAKAIQFGSLASEKLLPDAPEETKNTMAMTIACAIVAQVSMHVCTKACGGNPVASVGMVAMAVQAIVKDAEGGAA